MMRHLNHTVTRIPMMLLLLWVAVLVPTTASQASAGAISPLAAQPSPHSLRGGVLATFVVAGEHFRLWVTNAATIHQLFRLQRGQSKATIPIGPLLRGPGRANYNAPWHWHLDPRQTHMAEMTTEVCDARPTYVEQHLHEFVTKVRRYCPWGAKLIKLQDYR